MYDCLNGINTNICKIVALFFADDGIILMQSLQEARESIQVLTDINKINKRKSCILIYNNKNQPTQIEDIPVTSSFVYLGVTLQNKRDCYKLHRIESMNKAKKYSNLMLAVIAKSCNKLLIGKTYCKSAALPSILHGTEVIFLSKKYIADLQTVENKALRYTVNARKATAISALRGEIGSSLQTSRDMWSKIFYIKHILLHNNLLKEILLHQFEERQPSKWIKQIKTYMQDLNINLHAIEHYSPAKIKKLVKSWDDSLWMKDMQDKSTMCIYRKFKHTIRDEQDLYDNTASSVTLFRARTGTLKLNWERRHTDGHIICDLCKMNLIEDIHHFLMEYTAITDTRKKTSWDYRGHI